MRKESEWIRENSRDDLFPEPKRRRRSSATSADDLVKEDAEAGAKTNQGQLKKMDVQ